MSEITESQGDILSQDTEPQSKNSADANESDTAEKVRFLQSHPAQVSEADAKIKSKGGTPWWESESQIGLPLNQILNQPAGTPGITEIISKIRKEPISAALLEKRPDSVLNAIENKFKLLNSIEDPPYVSNGQREYKFGGGIAGAEITAALLKDAGDLPLQILDLGTGDGAFIMEQRRKFRNRVITTGISGINHKYWNGDVEGVDYKVADVERLQQQIKPGSFDLIVSRATFTHLVDPLGTLVQGYDALKPGGVMAVDFFDTPGIGNGAADMVEGLKMSGYKIEAGYDYFIDAEGNLGTSKIRSLMIRKTHPTLVLPVTYNGMDEADKVRYSFIEKLPRQNLPLPSEFKEYMDLMLKIYPGLAGADRYFDELLVNDNPTYSMINRDPGDSLLATIIRGWQESNRQYTKSGDADPKVIALREEVSGILPGVFVAWCEMYRNPHSIREKVRAELGLDISA